MLLILGVGSRFSLHRAPTTRTERKAVFQKRQQWLLLPPRRSKRFDSIRLDLFKEARPSSSSSSSLLIRSIQQWLCKVSSVVAAAAAAAVVVVVVVVVAAEGGWINRTQ